MYVLIEVPVCVAVSCTLDCATAIAGKMGPSGNNVISRKTTIRWDRLWRSSGFNPRAAALLLGFPWLCERRLPTQMAQVSNISQQREQVGIHVHKLHGEQDCYFTRLEPVAKFIEVPFRLFPSRGIALPLKRILTH